MERAKKIIAVFLSVLLLISCLTATVFAAETHTQDGLTAVIQTDKENYSANEDIRITVTVTNNNSFEVKNVSIESFLPDALTLKDGNLKSKTVDLQSGETLTLACVAILEKEEQSSSENETSESTTEETTTEITETTETATETTEPITDETSTTPDTTTSETDDILPIEPSTNESNPDATTESVSQESNPANPDTGDNSPFVKVLIALIIAMAIIAAYIIIAKKNNKKATKVISLVLCGAIAISSVATIGFIKVGAEESNTRSFTVDKTITVDGDSYDLDANIFYENIENEDYELSDEELSQMNEVDELISEFIKSEEYKNLENNELKAESLISFLNKLVVDGLIQEKSIIYYQGTNQIGFTYTNGVSGGIYINSFNDLIGSVEVTTALSNAKIAQNNSDNSQSTEKTSHELNNSIMTYGWDNPNTSSIYSKWNDLVKRINESYGLISSIYNMPSVRDYKTLFLDTDFICIAEHGCYDSSTTTYCFQVLGDTVSKASDKEYCNDFSPNSNRILRRNVGGVNRYFITPEFFSYYYGDSQLDGSIVFISSCMGFGANNNIDYKFAEAFYWDCGADAVIGYHNSVWLEYSRELIDMFMMYLSLGYTTDEALNLSKSFCGNNDKEWAEDNAQQVLYEKVKNDPPAYPILYGDKDKVLDSTPGKITGTVRDSVTTAPISGVKVYAEENGITRSCYTNENGGFELALPVGHHILHYSHDNYEHAMNGFDIEKDATTVIMEPIYLTPKDTETPENPEIPSTALEFNGHYYQFYDKTGLNWEEAKEYCEELGGHLVTITSEEEQAFIYDNIKNKQMKSYWAGGLKVDSEWTWITGEDWSYTNWNSGEPNNDSDCEYYLHVLDTGLWNDTKLDMRPADTNTSNSSFICEWDNGNNVGTCITKMEIVDHGQYTGNMGDSCVLHLDGSGLPGYDNTGHRNGNIGLDGTEYNNGFEVWIARWNFTEEVSWAYATYKLDGKYTQLTGKTSLIKGSANTDNFDTTIYFYNGDTLLQSYNLTNSDYEKQIKVDVTGVNELKILVKDNKAVKRGTSFALYDMFLK